jgi:glycosyltransferase involved in cell wall biosynthesis
LNEARRHGHSTVGVDGPDELRKDERSRMSGADRCSQMRIIYLHQYFRTPDMAGGTRSFEIGRRLVAAGHSVEMVTSSQEPSSSRDWRITDVAGMRVHWIGVPYSNYMSYRSRVRAFIRFATSAALRATEFDGDVVLATSTPLTIALPAVYLARRKRIPMVFEVRDLWPQLPIAMGALKNPLFRWCARRLERLAYANAARVVALSPGMAAGVAGTGYPAHRVSVVPNGSDLDFFRRDRTLGSEFRQMLGIPDDKIVVGYAGTLGRVNGVEYLVRLAAALKGDDRFAFLTVGDGQERERVAQLAREHGVLNQTFLMVPELAKAKMPAVLSAVDVATSLFLPLPEMEANSANKFFDALAAGCCVAINYGGWQAELLQEARAGIRLGIDPQQGAKDLQALADHPGRITSFGLNARRLAEERFSRDALAAQIEAILSEAVAEGRAQLVRETNPSGVNV